MVSKLCFGNDVVVGYDFNFFVVKNRKTHQEILRGRHNEGLYKIHCSNHSATLACSANPTPTFSSLKFVFSSNVSDVKLWHARLGHPSADVLSKCSRLVIFYLQLIEKSMFAMLVYFVNIIVCLFFINELCCYTV